MLFLRLLAVLLKDVGRDLLRHRGQHFLAIVTLASGLVLAGGGLLAVESLDRWVSRMESQAKVTVFAAEGGKLEETEGILRASGFEALPGPVRERLADLGLAEDFAPAARNLRLLLG